MINLQKHKNSMQNNNLFISYFAVKNIVSANYFSRFQYFSKMFPIFAAIHAKNQNLIYVCVAIFLPQIERYATITRLSTLLVTTLHKSVMILGGIRGDSLFYLYNFHSTMPRINENYRSANNSTAPVTPHSAKTVPVAEFNIEMNAKNRAYYFILSHGLLDQFGKFCKDYHPSNPHRDCEDYLFSKQTSHA